MNEFVTKQKQLHIEAVDVLRRIEAVDSLLEDAKTANKYQGQKNKDEEHLYARKATLTKKYHDVLKKIIEPIVGEEEQRSEPNAKNVVTIAEQQLKD